MPTPSSSSCISASPIMARCAVEHMMNMLQAMIKRAGKRGLQLAPFIGIGCPGLIRHDGSHRERWTEPARRLGAQELFNLPQLLGAAISTIDGNEVTVLIHNDAVVQGLSKVPFMRDIDHWGVRTIGTGLGTARFTNRTLGQE